MSTPIIKYTSLGIEESYYNENNQLHREGDLPARIVHYKYKDNKLVAYYVNGILQRNNDKPAFTYQQNYDCSSITSSDDEYKNFKGRVMLAFNKMRSC